MATLTSTDLGRISFPLALPMDKHIDIVPFDQMRSIENSN